VSRSRRIAIVPALNEEASVAAVVDEIRAVDPSFAILVIDDGSTDATAVAAGSRGARVVSLPFNLGIGGAMQTGYRYALEHDYDLAVQVDGDGQHDPAELPALLAPLLAGEADLVVGSRCAGRGLYRAPRFRRAGMRLFAWTASRMAGQELTDTTSGFRAVNRRGIALFAEDYPHDYPEVEAVVTVARARLRVAEVPVAMRLRTGGRSSIAGLTGPYYMVKVLVAVVVGLLRRPVTPAEIA
jgi:glycosyltransferase involved in cell wall biosynthesis